MRKTVTIAGSVILASAIGLGLFLRPKSTGQERLAEPASIPAIARQILRTKMNRHDMQMRTLMSRVVLLDDDGVARAAGEIFDEPAVARPVAGDELNGLLPARFFALQDELKSRARRLVAASTNRDHAAMADEFAALARSCVSCHQVYLHGDDTPGPAAEARP
jgi:cytochrome c'